ncbi:hypothetical protein [Streptomyces sp. NBC_01483]|nr:hypothetical protein [Streptomyces sp. NBC_01483]
MPELWAGMDAGKGAHHALDPGLGFSKRPEHDWAPQSIQGRCHVG